MWVLGIKLQPSAKQRCSHQALIDSLFFFFLVLPHITADFRRWEKEDQAVFKNVNFRNTVKLFIDKGKINLLRFQTKLLKYAGGQKAE